jgi:hypothetical protein
MCQPISYTYPNCNHLIAAPSVWILERCWRALAIHRDCWLPPNYPPEDIQRRPWPGKPLVEGCPICAAEQQAQQAASSNVSFSHGG